MFFIIYFGTITTMPLGLFFFCYAAVFLPVLITQGLSDKLDVMYQCMKRNIRALQLKAGKGAMHEYVTLSYGAYISHFEEDFVLKEKTRLADAQLYISKNNGRDRITVVSG